MNASRSDAAAAEAAEAAGGANVAVVRFDDAYREGQDPGGEVGDGMAAAAGAAAAAGDIPNTGSDPLLLCTHAAVAANEVGLAWPRTGSETPADAWVGRHPYRYPSQQHQHCWIRPASQEHGPLE